MKLNLLPSIIAAYILCHAAYWFVGSSDMGWVVFYYGCEKLFSALCLYFVYRLSYSRLIRLSALYGISVSVFMFGYFLWCYGFGHDSVMAVGAFLVYSFVILTWIRIKS